MDDGGMPHQGSGRHATCTTGKDRGQAWDGVSRSVMDARDLYLSHSPADVEVARELRTVLEAAGYSCWMAPDDIVGTDTSIEQILGAINASRAILVLVSTNSNRSTDVASEVSLATGGNRAVIP